MQEFVGDVWRSVSWSDEGHWAAAGEIASALAAFAAVVILIRGLSQIRDARDRFRAEVAPYLRVDLSPDPADGRLAGQNWFPPRDPDADLTYEDLNGNVRPQTELSAWAGDLKVFLEVTNQQTGAAGVADDVEVTVELAYPDRVMNDIQLGETQVVRFAYLEPDHINRYLLAEVDPEIPYLRGSVTVVSYWDMWRKRRFWWHGSGAFELNQRLLINSRTASHQGDG